MIKKRRRRKQKRERERKKLASQQITQYSIKQTQKRKESTLSLRDDSKSLIFKMSFAIETQKNKITKHTRDKIKHWRHRLASQSPCVHAIAGAFRRFEQKNMRANSFISAVN